MTEVFRRAIRCGWHVAGLFILAIALTASAAVAQILYGSIVGAVNQIGRSMGISTIAKQVGSEPILNRIRALGIGYAQGHALTAPVPLTDADGRVMLRSLRRSA